MWVYQHYFLIQVNQLLDHGHFFSGFNPLRDYNEGKQHTGIQKQMLMMMMMMMSLVQKKRLI